MKKQLGNATFNVTLCVEDYGSETNGECCWVLSVGALLRIFARFPDMEEMGMIPDAIGDAIEHGQAREGVETAKKLADLDAEESVSIRDADSGIGLVAAMAEIGGEWDVQWQGENETWFFHDWDHATHDTYIGSRMPHIGNIDWDTERRAQVNGAREALKAGISIDDVCSAVASITEEFESRFKAPIGNIWSDIFRGMVVVPK